MSSAGRHALPHFLRSSDETIARGIEALENSRKRDEPLPKNLDLVDYLRHAFQSGNGGLRQLLQIETGNLAAEIEPPAVIFAPDSLCGQVRVVQNTVFRHGKDLVGLRFVLEGFQKLHSVGRARGEDLDCCHVPLLSCAKALLARGAWIIPSLVAIRLCTFVRIYQMSIPVLFGQYRKQSTC